MRGMQDLMRLTAVRRVLAAVRRYRFVGLSFFIFVILGTLFFTFSQDELYRATSVVELRWNPKTEVFPFRDVSTQETWGGYWSYDEFRNTQIEVIRSRRVLQRVVDVLGDPSLTPALLEARLTVEPVPDSRLIRVSYMDTSPQRAADIANTVVQAYMDVGVENRIRWIQQIVDWLRDRIDNTQDDIGRAQKDLFEFQKEMGSINLDKDRQQIEAEIDALHARYIDAHTRRIQLEGQLREMKRLAEQGNSGLQQLAHALAVEDRQGAVATIQKRWVELQAERAGLSAVYGDAHPKMQALDRQLNALRSELLEAARKRIDGIRAQMDIATAEEEELLKAMDELVSAALDRSKIWQRYQELSDEAVSRRQFYEVLLERFKEIDITRDLNREQAVLIESAVPPAVAAWPNVRVNLAVGLFLALTGAIGMALLLNLLQQGVQNSEDLEAAIGVRALAELPYLQTDSIDYPLEKLMLHDPDSPLAESIRVVRNHILFAPRGRRIRAILFTGAQPLEGKTTTANNLAIATAQAGRRVLLVDADLRKAATSKVWKARGRRGFADVLSGNARWQDVVQPTEVANLSVMGTGGDPSHPPELFQKEALERVLPVLQQEWDIVIFDGSPLLLVADSIVVSSVVDETFIVMEAGRIHKREARDLVARLERIGQPTWEIILNKVTLPSAWGYDGYGYGYSYGYGSRGESELLVDQGDVTVETV
ncbi:MAG: polysaccharide biosynthesis tyrosine autokinase [Candidatus Dadabacteria bacterium]|nr:MAG: polysaccharide biosynthesis tyrosine autokinase [Candidatus Dadabacteria bacterium]